MKGMETLAAPGVFFFLLLLLICLSCLLLFFHLLCACTLLRPDIESSLGEDNLDGQKGGEFMDTEKLGALNSIGCI